MKKYILLSMALGMAGCAGTRHAIHATARNTHDTVYVSARQYDSVHVYRNHYSDYRRGTADTASCVPDTIVLRDVSVEYRYKYLRDTICKVRTDTLHVTHEVETVREVYRTPLWAKVLACIGACAIALACLWAALRKRIR